MNDTQERAFIALRNKYQDADSRLMIDDFERDMRKLIEVKNIADNPAFQEIVKDAQAKVDEINVLLMTDASMTPEKRAALFHEKKVWAFNISRFGATTNDRALAILEERIQHELIK